MNRRNFLRWFRKNIKSKYFLAKRHVFEDFHLLFYFHFLDFSFLDYLEHCSTASFEEAAGVFVGQRGRTAVAEDASTAPPSRFAGALFFAKALWSRGGDFGEGALRSDGDELLPLLLSGLSEPETFAGNLGSIFAGVTLVSSCAWLGSDLATVRHERFHLCLGRLSIIFFRRTEFLTWITSPPPKKTKQNKTKQINIF